MIKKNNKASYGGLMAKRNGERFEHLLDVMCAQYRSRGLACIQKTPEPMKPIRAINRNKGLYQAVFTKKAQPDYSGTLNNGKSIVFEAKHTDTSNLPCNRINSAQVRDLNAHSKLGALTYIVISFSMKNFYVVPWKKWQELLKSTGKKSLNQKDLVEFEISTKNGLLNLLEDIS
ncbi:MAG: Holliday junction resolvase RecU [Tetragenococcus koreensis]|nr:Holliday junction resolvase RecU [Tetragenococcus koreensis]